MTYSSTRITLIIGLLVILTWIAPVQAQTWTTFGEDLSNRVRAMHVDGNDIYVGGDFASVTGDETMSRIARWDGSQWHPVGQGVNNRVYAMAAVGSHLYVAGRLTEAINADGSTVAVAGVAMWDGSEWHALGSGLEGPSATLGFAMVVAGDQVYIGGNMTAAGGSAVSNIAVWDDTQQTWSAVGAGFMDIVRTLAYDSATETLYAGGSFDVANDGDQFNFIAAWDGFRWNALGDGLSETARTIAIAENIIFVGGGSGTLPVLAGWDGSTWHNLNEGLDDRVDVLLAVSDDVVYASGDFLNIGGVAAERLAMATTGSWSAVGAGLDDKAIVMKMQGSDIVIGGEFATANGEVSNNLVIYTPPDLTASEEEGVPQSFALQQNYPNPFNPVTVIGYDLNSAGNVDLRIFDLLGREIETLVHGYQSAGQHTVRFNAGGLPSGMYVYTLQLDKHIETRAMLLAR